MTRHLFRAATTMVALATLVGVHPQHAAAAASKQQVFLQAKEAYTQGDYGRAAVLCQRFIAASDKSAEKYESAQFFLAASLRRLGLYHAAVEFYFQVANNRRNPELLPRAIRALQEISLSRPIDHGLVLRDLIGDTDFGNLPEDLGDFVAYWQGVSNLHRGLGEWANERFARIRPIGYYFYLGSYAAAVRLLAGGNRADQLFAAQAFAQLFGPLDLGAALESLRRRGESDGPMAYSLKALLNEDNQVDIKFNRLPKGWQVELAMLGFARIAAETEAVLARSRETDDEELGRPFAYQVHVGGFPIYRRAPRFEDRAPMIRAVASQRAAVRAIHARSLHALARLLFEQKRYAAAYDTLGKIPSKTELSSEILLERAWSKYKAGDAHRSMGLLYALDAPVYRHLFAPEKYVLRGLIYRHFCHFRAAKVAARRFRLRFGTTLRLIREGQPVERIKKVRAAALRRGETMRLHLFYRSLRNEVDLLRGFKDSWYKSGLYNVLRHQYRSKTKQIRAELARELVKTATEVADEMLRTEEQVHLLEYEVGQAIFDRVSESSATSIRRPTPKVPITSNRVYYRFGGEYWTDELPWYKFNIENRCID